MERRTSTAPLLESAAMEAERSDLESQSPAHHALRNNLDSSLTLKKKNSWFHLGGTLRKSALSIKGAIDYVRGEQSQPQGDDLQRLPSEESNERKSTEADLRKTPSRPRMTERRSTFTQKQAVASLRQHFPRQSTRQKRGSVHSIFKDPDSIGGAGAEGPERFSTDSHDDRKPTNHNRRSSVADSLVGSVRSISHRVSLRKSAIPTELQSPRKRSPERIPLPSSPIDIPNAPPALSLNLGPTGFISPTFGGSLEEEHKEELTKLTDPKNITSGLPERHGLHVPAELEAKAHKDDRARMSSTPSNVLHIALPDTTFDPAKSPAQPDGLSTPMPGTNLTLEMDGSNGKPAVFERSVEPPDSSPGRTGQGIRQIRSLDALAQSYTNGSHNDGANDSTDALAEAAGVAHQADEVEPQTGKADAGVVDAVAATPAVVRISDTTVKFAPLAVDDEQLKGNLGCLSSSQTKESPVSELRPPPLVIPTKARPIARRDLLSSSTVDTCPSDMAPLSHQSTPRAGDDVDHGDIERWQQSDIHLWKRDKYTHQQDERKDSAVEAAPNADSGPPSPSRSVELPYRFKASAETSSSFSNAPTVSTPKPTCRMVEPSPSPIRQGSASKHENEAPPPRNVCDDRDFVITDYDEFKTQHIFCNNDEIISLPDYDNANSSPDASPGGPLGPCLFEAAASTSHNSSPTSANAGVLRSTDVSSVFWKFSVSSWLGDDDVDEASIDDDSDSTETELLPISPSSTDPHRTPSMGNRLDFELQRSVRNMRYNALHAGSSGHVVEHSERPESSAWTFCAQEAFDEVELPLASSYDAHTTEASAGACNLGHAEESSLGSTDSAGTTSSGDSLRQILKSAIRDTNHEQAILGEGSDDEPGFQDYANVPDAVQTSSPVRLTEWERQALQVALPSQAYGVGRRVVSSEQSPKMITQAELMLPSTLSSSPTGGVTSSGFSPTSSIKNVSGNRFAALEYVRSSSPDSVALRQDDERAPGQLNRTADTNGDGACPSNKQNSILRGMSSPNSGYDADSSAESSEVSPPTKEQAVERPRYRARAVVGRAK